MYGYATSPSGYSSTTYTEKNKVVISPMTLSLRGSVALVPMEEGRETFVYAFGLQQQGTLTVECLLKQTSKSIQIGYLAIDETTQRPIVQETVMQSFQGISIKPVDRAFIRFSFSWCNENEYRIQLFQDDNKVFDQVLSASQVYPAISYGYEPYQTIRVEVLKATTCSLDALAKWSNLISQIDDMNWQTTFVNGIEQSALDGSYCAKDGNRLMSTQYGYSFGEAEVVVTTGKTGIAGIGVCCRPGRFS